MVQFDLGAEEVVVDVLLPLVAEEGDNVPEVGVPCSQLAGGEQVRAGTRAHEEPELAGQSAHLADRGVAVHPDNLVNHVPMAGEDAGDEAVGDSLDQVSAHLAAHQEARLVRLDGYHLAGPVPLAEALTHADDSASGADPADHGVGHRAVRQLSERLRAEPRAVLVDVPLRVELLRREIPRLATEFGDLGQGVINVKSPSVMTCAPKAREIASRSPLVPLGMTTSIR